MKRVFVGLGVFGFILLASIFSNNAFLTDTAAAQVKDPTFNWADSYLDGDVLSQKQVTWCVANLSGETAETLALDITTTAGQYISDCTNPARKGPCHTDDVDEGSTTFTCTTYITEDNEVYQAVLAAKKLETTQLAILACGQPTNGAQAEALLACQKEVSEKYLSDKCYYANQKMIDGRGTAKQAAECVYPTVRKYNKTATIADVLAAIRQGRKEANAAIKETVDKQTQKSECTNDGGTWKDDECKPAEAGTTCAIEGMGWLICPAVRVIAAFNDALFGMINNLLDINPSLFERKGSGAAIYNAWSGMRNIANVAFVIAFLFVIYSQLTSVGISNYGIKKLLPKMFIAAILVNISFIVCALAVDLSNITGASLHDLMIDQTRKLGDDAGANLDMWDGIMTFLLGGAIGTLAIGGVALSAGGVTFMALLALFIPLAITALVAALTVLFILVAREAFIIILVALSPLAFVAYLLPNTEQWFDRWRKTFISMLLIYPLVAMLFGGSQLASAVIRAGAEDALTYILSLVVLVVPLFATPLLLKFSGGLIGRVAGMINNPNKGPFDRLKKAGVGYANRKRDYDSEFNRTKAIREGTAGKGLGAVGSKRRRAATWLAGIGNENDVNRKQAEEWSEGGRKYQERKYFADRASSDESYALALGKGNEHVAQQVKDYAKQANAEERVKDIKAATARLAHLDNATVAQIAATGMYEGKKASSEVFAAATHRVQDTGSFDERRANLEFLAQNKSTAFGKDLGMDATLRGEAAQKAIARGDSKIYGAGFGNELVSETGKITDGASLSQAAVDNAAGGSLNAQHLVQGDASTKFLVDTIMASNDQSAKDKLKAAADIARSQTSTAASVTDKIDQAFKRAGSAGQAGPVQGPAPQPAPAPSGRTTTRFNGGNNPNP